MQQPYDYPNMIAHMLRDPRFMEGLVDALIADERVIDAIISRFEVRGIIRRITNRLPVFLEDWGSWTHAKRALWYQENWGIEKIRVANALASDPRNPWEISQLVPYDIYLIDMISPASSQFIFAAAQKWLKEVQETNPQ